MDNPDQEILYAIRDEIAQQQLSMNNAGLALGTGNAVLDSSRAQWQAQPDSLITVSAVQLAAALAAAKYQALQHAYQVAQDAVTRAASHARDQANSANGAGAQPYVEPATRRDLPTEEDAAPPARS